MAGRRSRRDAAPFDAAFDSAVTETAEAIEAAAADLDMDKAVEDDPLAEAVGAPPPAQVVPVAVEKVEAPKPAPLPVGDFSDVEIVPKYLIGGFSTKPIVHASGVRGIIVIQGALSVLDENEKLSARVMPGGYVFFSKAQVYALAAEKDVRAVFVQSPGYDETVQEHVPAEPVARPPVAVDAPSWADASPTVRASGGESPVPLAPVPVATIAAPRAQATVQRAVAQLEAMQAQRGRKTVRVSHPNEIVPVPSAAPVNPANGAPRPVQDSPSASWTGERLVS